MTSPKSKQTGFSDENLEKFKYALKNIWAIAFDRDELESLIRRLDAAEAVCGALWDSVSNDGIGVYPTGIENPLRHWRKSAGKGGQGDE